MNNFVSKNVRLTSTRLEKCIVSNKLQSTTDNETVPRNFLANHHKFLFAIVRKVHKCIFVFCNDLYHAECNKFCLFPFNGKACHTSYISILCVKISFFVEFEISIWIFEIFINKKQNSFK